MATSAESASLARQRAIATENDASEQVIHDRRKVLRQRENFPDTNPVMCDAMRELAASKVAFTKARRVAEQADRDCEQSFADDRQHRLESHRQNYEALESEVEDEIRFGVEQEDGSFASYQAVSSGEESSSDDDGDSEFEDPAEAPLQFGIPHTRSRGSVSPLSVTGEAEYTQSLQPRNEDEKTEETRDQNVGGSESDK